MAAPGPARRALRELARNLEEARDDEWRPIGDDVLRLVFTACHPVLSRESQVALTLRVVGGLTSVEIGRMLLSPVATVQQRITRAKRTLAEAHVPFETPEPNEWPQRLSGVLGVVYLVFTEGYAATAGDAWMRPDLANEALRLGRVLAGLLPREPEVHALVALMEFQASRFGARRMPPATRFCSPTRSGGAGTWRRFVAAARPSLAPTRSAADGARIRFRPRSRSATLSRRASSRRTGTG